MGAWSDFTGWLRGTPKEEDRRAESRLAIHDSARMRWESEDGQAKSASVNLIDVSSVGFKVRCAEELPAGLRLTLTDDTGRTAEAQVMHCEKDDDAYLIGAKADWRTPGEESESESQPSTAQPAA